MNGISPEILLIVLCGLVILSFLFSILSKYIRVPSVLLLLFAGIGLRALANYYRFAINIPDVIVESLGVVGLIMIVLEAGLDLNLNKRKLSLVRNSFLSATVILMLSAALITLILNYWLKEPIASCLVYALPLSIMSSSIVLPSIHHLTASKKEFLIYEASFSDIMGILLFNYFTAKEILTVLSLATFVANIVVAIILSLLISIGLLFILARTKMNIRFFLIFALLILIYEGGKMAGLPSLLAILVFGLTINNWDAVKLPTILDRFRKEEVQSLRTLLHSITAESSFLIRTFFFLLFGFTIQLKSIMQGEVILVGSMIVISLFFIRLVYFRFFLNTNMFPEAFLIPRGLITIVLFYKIPAAFKLGTFNEGILFFVILSTSIIMALGMIFYKKGADEVVEEPQFSERTDIL
ncbi:MAG: sodium:proton exchanger [Chitinophagaceae bacterium]